MEKEKGIMTPQVGKRRLRFTSLLLTLAFLTAGVAFCGGDAARPGSETSTPAPLPVLASETVGQVQVIVYYLHPTFRCVTCKTTEDMTRSLLESQFKEALEQGRIEWKVADFQKEADLGQRFGAQINCVVVVQVKDGKEGDFQRLDEISALMDDPAAFEKYVGDAIRKYLPQGLAGGQRQ